MGKKKNENKISKNEQQLLDGLTLVKGHPLFGHIDKFLFNFKIIIRNFSLN